MQVSINVFSGPEAIKDFLDPGKLPYVPLLEILMALNPFATDGVRILRQDEEPLAAGQGQGDSALQHDQGKSALR